MQYQPKSEDYEFLKDKQCFIFDIDGTVAWGTNPIPEARDFILRLRACSKRVVFYTNNPNRSHEQAARYLSDMGFEVTPEEIVSSEDLTFSYLREHCPGGRVFVLGIPTMEQNFKAAGFDVVGMEAESAEAVVVGFDQSMTYDRATKACRLVLGGATLIGTHPDRLTPGQDGMVIDCGSICAMITSATEVEPVYMGKPTPYGLALIEKLTGLSADAMCMVGDRLYTDIAFGNNSGMTSLLVLTGGTSLKEALEAKGNERPDVILPHLGYVSELLG